MRDAARRRAAVGREVAVLKQVHGTVVRRAGASGTRPDTEGAFGTAVHAATAGPAIRLEGDGWVSDVPGVCVGVYVADCQPILMWDLAGRAVGAFHAGWRRTAAGMGAAAVEAMRGLGVVPDSLAAAIGPHAKACCYRVGPEVAARFHPDNVRDGRLDLAAEMRRQLVEAGVRPENVSVSDACTMCRPQDFFSYRREGCPDGMLAFIELPA